MLTSTVIFDKDDSLFSTPLFVSMFRSLLCVCMYVYIYIYTYGYLCMCALAHVRGFVCLGVRAVLCTCDRVYVRSCVRIYVCMYVFMWDSAPCL